MPRGDEAVKDDALARSRASTQPLRTVLTRWRSSRPARHLRRAQPEWVSPTGCGPSYECGEARCRCEAASVVGGDLHDFLLYGVLPYVAFVMFLS